MIKKKFRQDLSLAIASVACAVLIVELGFRAWAAWGWAWTSPRDAREVPDFWRLVRTSDHPEIGIDLRPNVDVKFLGKTFRTNSQGYRGGEFGPKQPGTFRIIGIGDSVMMGWGAGQDKTYLYRLEEILNGKLNTPHVETLNFGVAGYNTVQEYFVLRDRALAFEPDLVILGYVGNDLDGPNFKRAAWRFSCPSYALNYLVLHWRLWRGTLSPREAYDWRWSGGGVGHVPQGFQEAYGDIADLLRERGIPLVTVLDSRYQNEVIRHAQVKSLGDFLGATTIDLYRLYRRLPPNLNRYQETHIKDEHNRLYSIPGDTHCNEAWHERTARVIAGVLVERNLIKSAR